MYQFLPSPDLAYKECTHVYWENAFSDDEIQRIIDIGDIANQSDAIINGEKPIDYDIRRSTVAWLNYNNDTAFLYDYMASIARNLNGQFFGFNLFGFNESMQYTVYKDNGGHYDWHMDKGILSSSPRKLSLVLQLSDPSEYEGGDLEIMVSKDVIKLEKRKGLVWAFPSWILHRVTPVTKGIRRTIVVWVTGPKFV